MTPLFTVSPISSRAALVQANRSRYCESTFAAKRGVIAEVINKIKINGGRFVRIKENIWSVVPDSVSRLKVAHAIQYHIRTEVAQHKELQFSPADDTMNLNPIPEEELSDHDRVVRAIREKVAKMQNQHELSELPTSYRNSRNDLNWCNTNVHQIEFSNTKVGATVLQEEVSPRKVAVHSLVPPLVQEAISEFDHCIVDGQCNEFSEQYRRFPIAPTVAFSPSWTKRLCDDASDMLLPQMPEINSGTEESEYFSERRLKATAYRRCTFPCSGPIRSKILNDSLQRIELNDPIPPIFRMQSLEDEPQDKDKSCISDFTRSSPHINNSPTNSLERHGSRINFDFIDCNKKRLPNEAQCDLTGISVFDGFSVFSGRNGSNDTPIYTQKRLSSNPYPREANTGDAINHQGTFGSTTTHPRKNVTKISSLHESRPRSPIRSLQLPSSTMEVSLSTRLESSPFGLFRVGSDFGRNADDFTFT